jgi:hypothetical protein
MNSPAKTIGVLLGCIGEVLCIGGSCHRLFVNLLFLSSPMNLKFLGTKKEAQEAFVDGTK